MIQWLWHGLVLKAYSKLVGNSIVGARFLKESADQEYGEGTFARIILSWVGLILVFSIIICLICC